MNNNIEFNQIIMTTPSNTLNLPEGKQPNLSNPQITSNVKYEVANPRQTHRVPLGTETDYYDPTKKMVNEYLDTNKSMYDNRGKYFDTYLFNQKFDEYIKKKTAERKLKEQVQLYDLDNIENIQVQPYELPLNKILINFKNVWFQLFDDLINGTNPSNLFITSNFFYFGITFIVIFLLYIMLSYIFE
jgi:hypothetical protein